MANNYIEEFFISIGFDTKKVKKEAKEVDKVLDGLVKKRASGVRKETQYVKKSEEEKASAVKAAEAKKQAAIKKTRDLLNRRVQLQARGIQRSSSYQNLRAKGELGTVDTRMADLVKRRDIEGLKDLKAEITRTNTAMMKLRRTQIGLRTAQNGLTDSTRNMVRQYASLYALFQGTTAIKKVGQDFEGMEAGLAAVSGTAEQTTANLAFLRKESMRLGFDMVTGSKAYVKLLAAAEGKATKTELEDSFISIMEAATVFQLSMDDTTGTIKAIQQMFSKAGIMAQEFKEQLGDRMPIAMRALEKSTGKTAKELFKMMELGQLGAEYIVPFTKALGDLADQNGALGKSLATNKKLEDKLINTSKLAGDEIFKGGFSEGLSELYNTMTKFLESAGPQLKKIGAAFGAIFKALSHMIKVVEPFFKLAIDNMNILFGGFMLSKIVTFSSAAGFALSKAFWPITLALMALEEIASLMSDKLVGVLESQLGFQVNAMNLTTTDMIEKNGEYFNNGKAQKSKGVNISRNMTMMPFAGGLLGAGMNMMDYFANEGSTTSTSSKVTVTNNNTFKVSDVQGFEAIQSAQYAAAMSPQTK